MTSDSDRQGDYSRLQPRDFEPPLPSPSESPTEACGPKDPCASEGADPRRPARRVPLKTWAVHPCPRVPRSQPASSAPRTPSCHRQPIPSALLPQPASAPLTCSTLQRLLLQVPCLRVGDSSDDDSRVRVGPRPCRRFQPGRPARRGSGPGP